MDICQLFGSLLPTSEDFHPIIEQVRSKYRLPPLRPGDEPITEIYRDDEDWNGLHPYIETNSINWAEDGQNAGGDPS